MTDPDRLDETDIDCALRVSDLSKDQLYSLLERSVAARLRLAAASPAEADLWALFETAVGGPGALNRLWYEAGDDLAKTVAIIDDLAGTLLRFQRDPNLRLALKNGDVHLTPSGASEDMTDYLDQGLVHDAAKIAGLVLAVLETGDKGDEGGWEHASEELFPLVARIEDHPTLLRMQAFT
jgi:hypothetical protein